MSKKNKNKQPPFVALYRTTIKSKAWKVMSVGARATFFALAYNYNTNMQNAVYLSARTGSKELGVHKDTVTKWLRELEFYGFIALVEKGTIGVYGYGRATTYRLTDRPHAGTSPTYNFQSWTGEIFDPKKQNPVLMARTPRPKKPDIEKIAPAKTVCPKKPDIRTPRARPKKPDITSLAISQGGEADAADPVGAPAGLQTWTTPTLTELPWSADWHRLYCEVMQMPGIGHNAGPPLDDLSIPAFLRRELA